MSSISQRAALSINQLLARAGLQLSRTEEARIPGDFMAVYERHLTQLRASPDGKDIIREPHYDTGVHPVFYRDYECAFAAQHISRVNPDRILDVGSARHFILGMLCHYRVTTLDVRRRDPATPNEEVVTSDAKAMSLPDNRFDVVVTISSIEHFGLGRYGDEFDLDADSKAVQEMIRVLKPGGRLIFTTSITCARPAIAFNAHRIYTYDMLHVLCDGLICEEERFFSRRGGRFCSLDEVTTKSGNSWDVYMGCWQKPV